VATFLSTLGRFAFRRRWIVLLAWVVVLLAFVFAASSSAKPANSPLTVPGTESQQAFDIIAQRFPGTAADGATARMVFQAPAGRSLELSTVRRVVAELRSGSAQVAAVTDPVVSRSGTIAYTQVSYKTTATELTTATLDALKKAARDGRAAGMVVETGGDALTAAPKVGSAEVIGLLVTALVLILTFGSLVAAGLPLVTALIGVAIGVTGITALSGPLHLSSTTSILALMIGLAVGIDYALFIVSRYRSELADGHEREVAIGRALGTAGSAVVFAGLTVVIALASLAVVGIPNLTKMGMAAAATIVVAVLIALTLTPALLGFAGRMVLARRTRKEQARTATAGLGTRWARFVLTRPAAVLIVAVLGLGVLALPVTGLRMALPDDGHLGKDTTQRKAYDMLTDGFGPGLNGPLLVVVDGGSDIKAAAAKAGAAIAKLPDVASVGPARFDTAGDAATLTVVPKSGPNDTATHDLVSSIRAGRTVDGARVLVTGRTALNIDISQRLSDAVPPYLALVVGLAFILLLVVFRSVLVPLKAALGFLLSVLAALGAIVAVFQWGWLAGAFGVEQTSPIMSTMPIFLIGVVFGLAMDYEVFLVSRMREAYASGADPRAAITAGFTHNARVVTAGALIMISVFAGFVGSTEAMIKMLGFGLGIAVLLDAFVVRMTIVPAALAILGRAAWWLPGPLDRILPTVSVESPADQELSPNPVTEPVA